MMWLERITGGNAALIEREKFKAYLRILSNETDTEADEAVLAASVHLDVDEDGFGGLGFPLVVQTWSMKVAKFSCGAVRLPFGRITSIDEIRFIDPAGVGGVVPSDVYMMAKQGRDVVLVLLPGKSWPRVADRPDAFDVRFTAGFASVADVPADIIEAAKVLASFRFHNRGVDLVKGLSDDVAAGVERLTRRYRKYAG